MEVMSNMGLSDLTAGGSGGADSDAFMATDIGCAAGDGARGSNENGSASA